jgi:outer membrane protein assembly factor BamB
MMRTEGKTQNKAVQTRRGHAALNRMFTVPLLGALVALAGCSDSLPSLPKLTELNPFAEKPKTLEGKRVAIIPDASAVGADLAPADKPILIAAFSGNEQWTQPGGTPNNSPGHLALTASIKVAWTADAGTGSSKYGKISASPIAFGGKVFTLDAAGTVSAFSISGGAQVWRTSLKPEGEKVAEKGYGGGIASDGGRVFAATGYGTIVALDGASGKQLWEKSIGVPFRTSPTVANGRVVAVAMDGEVVCLSTDDGNENWRYRGVDEKASIISNASPAIEGNLAIVPFTSGDVVGLNLATGQAVWTENLSRTRSASSLTSMTDAARPVIDNGTVFAVGHAGRMIASTLRGERLWQLSVPGVQQPVVSGDSVFVVNTQGQLLAITRRGGKVQWSAKLAGSTIWSGPVLAGGKLWLASSTGSLVAVEATTGKVVSTQELGQPVYIAPIVAGNRMFVLTDKAKLISLN